MLSCNTLLETRIQPLHDGVFIVEKVLGVLVQRMLEMSKCLYTCGNFKQNVEKKIYRTLVILFTIIIYQFSDLVPTSLFADILYGHCSHDRRLCIRKILMTREMAYFQKCDFFRFAIHFYYNLGRFRGTLCAY